MPMNVAPDIDRIKREVDLATLVRDSGVRLKREGRELRGFCPHHADRKHPSLSVSPDKGLWRCFSCGAAGDALTWVMKRDNVSFPRAKAMLLAYLGGKASGAVRRPAPLQATVDDPALLGQVVMHWHRTLRDTPRALSYLEARGLLDTRLLERFRIGFADRLLVSQLPGDKEEQEVLRARLQRIGVLREGSGAVHFAGCITVPVFEENGEVAQVYGRRIGPTGASSRHLVLPGPRRGIWNWQALSGAREVPEVPEVPEVIVAEGIIDGLTLVKAGFENVIACLGVEDFCMGHVEAMKRHGVERVVLAFDRDEAGERGAKRAAAMLGKVGIACARMELPHGMDVNAYAQKVTPADKSLGIAIQSARAMNNTAPPATTTEAAGKETPPPAALLPSPAPPPPPAPHPLATLRQALPEAVVRDGEVFIAMGERTYAARGLDKNMSMERLDVHLVCAAGESFHVDRLNLCSARARASFVKETAAELGAPEDLVKKELGRVMLKLEELQLEQIKKALEPKVKAVVLSEGRRTAALAHLRRPDLISWILSSLDACGVVGERTNKLLCYLASVSRLLPWPLAILVQSSSAAGKSALMEKVLELMPEEDRIKYSAMTGQSLYYMGERDLRHKILAIAEEEGASRASYALKLLQSEGELSIASTGKDPVTGKLVTQEYHVKGPVMLFLTTTAIDLDEELQNRCLVLAVDEGREQTRAIQRLQREMLTVDGLVKARRRAKVIGEHQDVQRMLRPLAVRIPFASRLTFPDYATRTRRDHVKYLTLIQTIALLHQHQRPVKTVTLDGEEQSYVEATVEDVALANELANEALGRSLGELPPQTQRFLDELHQQVTKVCQARKVERSSYRFGRREALDWTKLSMSVVRRHLDRLVEHEYVLVHRGKNGQSFVYELVYGGEAHERDRFMMGLIDVARLSSTGDLAHLDRHLAHPEGDLAPTLPPACSDLAPTLLTGGNGTNGTPPKASRGNGVFAQLKGLLDVVPKNGAGKAASPQPQS